MNDPQQAHSYKALHPLGRAVTFLLALGIVAAAVDLGHDIHLLVLLDAVIEERSREAVLDMAAAFELGDRILFPTLGIVAVPLEEVRPSDYPAGFTRPVNYLGMCAASVPMGLTPDNLPAGLQIVARAGEEATALRIGAAFERTRGPWRGPSL